MAEKGVAELLFERDQRHTINQSGNTRPNRKQEKGNKLELVSGHEARRINSAPKRNGQKNMCFATVQHPYIETRMVMGLVTLTRRRRPMGSLMLRVWLSKNMMGK